MWYNPKTPKTGITHRLDKVHIVSSKQGQNRLLNGCVHYGLIFNSERTSFGSFKEKNNENYKWEKDSKTLASPGFEPETFSVLD